MQWPLVQQLAPAMTFTEHGGNQVTREVMGNKEQV